MNVKTNIPMMPEEYKGKLLLNYHVKTRQWTNEEYDWVSNMLAKGFTKEEIAISTDRTVSSISDKLKHIRKQNNTYNQSHVIEKYETNIKFIKMIQPESALDLYCGVNNFYKDKIKNVTSNDKNKSITADYNMDAHKCICLLYSQNKKYDFIDLDPYGNAYDCFDLAIKMAKKGLAITLGEMYCKRWKNEQFTKKYYNLSLEEFTVENIIKYIQTIGTRNNKNISPVFIRKWKNIARVWFEVEQI